MATLAVEVIERAGLEPTYNAAAAGGDEFPNTGIEFIHVKNDAVGAQIVTIATPATVDGLAVADRAVTIPAGEERHIGPFPTSTYNDGTGHVQLTYDAVVTLFVAVLKLG